MGHGGHATIVFVDKKLKKAYFALTQGKGAEPELYKAIARALEKIECDCTAGISVPRYLWPKEYVKKYHIDNLWKYDLPNGWRMTYTVSKDEIKVIAIVLEWFDHKGYEGRFKY